MEMSTERIEQFREKVNGDLVDFFNQIEELHKKISD